jgi:hypothetical protein
VVAALTESVSAAMEMILVVSVEGDQAGERLDKLLRQYSCGIPTVERLQVSDSPCQNLQCWKKRKSKSDEPWWLKTEKESQ